MIRYKIICPNYPHVTFCDTLFSSLHDALHEINMLSLQWGFYFDYQKIETET